MTPSLSAAYTLGVRVVWFLAGCKLGGPRKRSGRSGQGPSPLFPADLPCGLERILKLSDPRPPGTGPGQEGLGWGGRAQASPSSSSVMGRKWSTSSSDLPSMTSTAWLMERFSSTLQRRPCRARPTTPVTPLATASLAEVTTWGREGGPSRLRRRPAPLLDPSVPLGGGSGSLAPSWLWASISPL